MVDVVMNALIEEVLRSLADVRSELKLINTQLEVLQVASVETANSIEALAEHLEIDLDDED